MRLSAEVQYLESELARTRELLEQVERQFITFERDLYTKETRASAVASLAEARLAHDKMARTHDASEAQKHLIKMVLAKIEASDQLLAKTRYNGSVYFSRRALLLIAGEQDRKLMRIVSVENANIRRGPGLNYEVVTQLALGTTLFQLDTKNEWVKIQTRTGVEGWIHTSVTGMP
ncbi:MAG: SH3 domain-containing protein [bacterium]|nr:SH3 domain-containing protein [bacterium]